MSSNSLFATKNRYALLSAVFLAALSLKLLILAVSDHTLFYKYPFFAERLGSGQGIGERILDLSPFYLYASLLYFKIFGSHWEGMAVFQILLGSLNCVLIYLIGEKMFSRTAGLLAALLLILYGNLTLFEITLEPEAFLLVINSLLLLALLSADRPWKWLLSGGLLGLAVITKPNSLLFLPFAILWIWRQPPPGRVRVQATLCLLLGTFVLVSPITLRNYVQFHDLVLVTADGGKVFYHGNGPDATGMERADLPDQFFNEQSAGEPDHSHALFREVARNITGRPLKASECSNFWIKQTLDHIRLHPLEALALEGKKFIYFWQNYEVHEIDPAYKNYRLIRQWPFLTFGLFSAFGIMGMVLLLPRSRHALLLYAMVAIYLVSSMIFFPVSRYRLPATPFLALFAAWALVKFRSLQQERRNKTLLGCIAITLALFAGTLLLLRPEVVALDRRQTATRIHYSMGGDYFFQKGLYREAAAEYQKAIELAPDFVPAYNALGMMWANLGDLAQAEESFRKVIELSPDSDQGYLNLGILYENTEKSGAAISLLQKAYALNPGNSKTRAHLQKLLGTD